MYGVYLTAGIICLAYYVAIGLYVRFNQSMSWFWLIAGVVFIIAALAVKHYNIARWAKIIWRTGLIFAIVTVIAVTVPVISHMDQELPDDLDYVIVLGARVDKDSTPTKALRGRIESAYDYLCMSPETVVIASGAQGYNEPISEAKCIYDNLTAMGIDPSRIIIEDKSENTNQNLTNSLSITGSDAKVGLITNNYHVCRALFYAKRAGYTDAKAQAVPYVGITLPHYIIREVFGLIVAFLFGH